MAGGVFVDSGGLCDRLFDTFDLVVACGAGLKHKYQNLLFALRIIYRSLTHLYVYHCSSVVYVLYKFWYLKNVCHNRYSIDQLVESIVQEV